MATKNPTPAARPNTTNKPAPVQAKPATNGSATQAKPPEAPKKEVDLDDEDLDTDTGTEAKDAADADDDDKEGGRNWMKTQKLPPAKREAVLVANLVNKLTRRFQTITGWEATEVAAPLASLQTALDSMKSAAEGLAALPDTFKPKNASGPSAAKAAKELVPGAIIRITDKRIEEYKGIVEDANMKGIKVVEVRGNKVIVTMPDGMKAMLPRGHVCHDETAPAA